MKVWQIRAGNLAMDRRALVMGILNITPDSFVDGGKCLRPEDAIAYGLKLVGQGADILDIGGESTRPGATPVPTEEELGRILPVVKGLVHQTQVPLSIDTSKASVAQACLEAGAQIINDVTALTGDPDMKVVVRSFKAGVILMHMQGTPATMQAAPHYDDVVHDILRFLETRVLSLTRDGVDRSRLVIDPGLGFGKTFQHNLEILVRLGELQKLNLPVCLGASRKGFIGQITSRPIQERLAGSLAAVSFALAQNAVQIVRVHDVQETRDTVLMWEKFQQQE